MAFKQFWLSIVIRVLIITFLSGISVYLLLILQFYISALVSILLLVGAVVSLIHYAQKSNKELSQFLMSVQHSDYNIRFPETGQGASFNQLRKTFNLILSDFQRIRLEKEVHHQFLQTVVTNIPIGIICADENGKVVIYNGTAKNLIQVNYLASLSQIEKVRPDLFSELNKLKNEQPLLYKSADDSINLQIKQIFFKLEDKNYKLLTLQNIKSELDFREMESWQKLIKVLTHEIMNSVTPIASLSATLDDMIQSEEIDSEVETDIQNDISSGIRAIRNRSQGLLRFVDNYRSLTRIPQPEFNTIKLKPLFERIAALLQQKLQDHKVVFTARVNEPGLHITADQEQIEQVLINLILNAVDAVEEKAEKRISLSAHVVNDKVNIRVQDNGVGIDKEILDKIFIPFYTTKEKGSGIGLSLSRQMLLMNKALLNVNSVKGEGSIFEVVFNKE